MYNDAIKVANKIISDNDLMDIFQRMNEELIENQAICRQETLQNERYEREYQHWTTKDFDGTFKCIFNFYDDTTVSVDNYNNFIMLFNNRIQEIKDLSIRYAYNYTIQQGKESKYIHQSIGMYIYEHRMDINFDLSSEDQKMNDIYQLIKEKVLKAPERYDRIIKKKSSILNKIGFAFGTIPSLILCTLLFLIPAIRNVYSMTYVAFPILVCLLGWIIGAAFMGGKLGSLYENITPNKKYAGYDSSKGKSIYKDDVDDYLSKSEIIIGKNINNIKNRKEITELEEKYSKYIPIELIAILILSVVVVVLGKIF